MGCQLCGDSRRRAYICAPDVNEYLQARREELATLREDCQIQLRHLTEATRAKAQAQAHALALQQLRAERDRLRAARFRTLRALEVAKTRHATVSTCLSARTKSLENARAKLAEALQRLARKNNHRVLQQNAGFLLLQETEIERMQRMAVQQLLEAFPLQKLDLELGHGGGTPGSVPGGTDHHATAIFVCTLPLPDVHDDLGALIPSSPQFAALGLLCTVLEVLARVLRLPLLHRAHICGSTTSVWEADGAVEGFPGSGTENGISPRACPRYLLGPQQPAGVEPAVGGPSPADIQATSLRRGLRLLERSAGCLATAAGGPGPWSSPPIERLVTLCLGVAAGHRAAGAGPTAAATNNPASSVLLASAYAGSASLMAESVLHGGLGAESLYVVRGGWSRRDGGRGNGAGGGVDGTGPASTARGGANPGSMAWSDEWEVLPLPAFGRLIPPPPNAEDDVEHWVRAMFAEESGRQGGGGQGTGTARIQEMAAATAQQLRRLPATLRGVWDTTVLPRLR